MDENLLQETIECIQENGRTIEDIECVIINDKSCSWSCFEKIADFEYCDGFGGEIINLDLMVVGKNKEWWIERHEYDGSEWWEYKEYPKIPEYGTIIRRDILTRYGNQEGTI